MPGLTVKNLRLYKSFAIFAVGIQISLISSTNRKGNMTREILEQFQGKQNVTKIICDNGIVVYLSQRRSFADEASSLGACKLNTVENDNKHVLFLFNKNDEEVGRYYIGKRLQGKTPSEIVGIKHNLEFFDSWNPNTKEWVPCIGMAKKNIKRKYGCGLWTILQDNKWRVEDTNSNIIVPPEKYDYIDGFDVCGLARVKKSGKTDLDNPQNSTNDAWGIINTRGEEILPLKYSEIWSFYNNGRKYIRIFEGGYDEDDYYVKRALEYHFIKPCKDYPNGKLLGPGEWIGRGFCTYEEIREKEIENTYSIWDALDGEAEAAGNIDYEW